MVHSSYANLHCALKSDNARLGSLAFKPRLRQPPHAARLEFPTVSSLTSRG